eukprot:scaffold10547_cov58-Phaeocystis_antarctica.AAC.4
MTLHCEEDSGLQVQIASTGNVPAGACLTGEAVRGTALRPGTALRGPLWAAPRGRATVSRETPPPTFASARFQVMLVPVAFMGRAGAATGRWRNRAADRARV